jgi:uncharacterized protein YecT (DUF1311 family)
VRVFLLLKKVCRLVITMTNEAKKAHSFKSYKERKAKKAKTTTTTTTSDHNASTNDSVVPYTPYQKTNQRKAFLQEYE